MFYRTRLSCRFLRCTGGVPAGHFYRTRLSCRFLRCTGCVPAAHFLHDKTVLQVPALHWGAPAAHVLQDKTVLQVPALHWGCSCSPFFTWPDCPAGSCAALGVFLQPIFYRTRLSCRFLRCTGGAPAAHFFRTRLSCRLLRCTGHVPAAHSSPRGRLQTHCAPTMPSDSQFVARHGTLKTTLENVAEK